ncbi:MAG: flavodoxin family protein [Candidatus Odinarchaeota archaeon]
MKVLAINSSLNMNEGYTAVILNPFLEGMEVTGAEIELFFTRKLRIKSCRACYDCWFKTPGRCAVNDDMQWLLPKFKKAEIWVLASPIYSDGINSQMKTVI